MKPVEHFEFGGGLGDVIHQSYENGYYCHLDRTGKDFARASIALVSHNPFVRELFDWHPKRALFDIKECGYWLPHQNNEMRKKHNLPARPHMPPLTTKPTFYPSPADLTTLSENPLGKYVVVSQAAGMADRDLDEFTVFRIVDLLWSKGVTSVFVGRSYERAGRREGLKDARRDGSVNLVDRLTVPGTLRLLEGSAGLVTCHSALNLAAWHMRKPQLLLYPKSVYSRHFVKGDQWSFGRSFRETYHACWDDKRVVDEKIFGFVEEVTK